MSTENRNTIRGKKIRSERETLEKRKNLQGTESRKKLPQPGILFEAETSKIFGEREEDKRGEGVVSVTSMRRSSPLPLRPGRRLVTLSVFLTKKANKKEENQNKLKTVEEV